MHFLNKCETFDGNLSLILLIYVNCGATSFLLLVSRFAMTFGFDVSLDDSDLESKLLILLLMYFQILIILLFKNLPIFWIFQWNLYIFWEMIVTIIEITCKPP